MGRVIAAAGSATVSQSAVLRVERDWLRNGGWNFKSFKPNQYGDNYAYADGAVQLRLGDIIPAGSTVTSAVLTWNFTNLNANTGASYGFNLPGGASSPMVHGGQTDCACSGFCQ